MTIVEMKETIVSLTKAEKLELIRFISTTLLKEECDLFEPGQIYAVWSPYDEHRAAEQLQTFIHSWNE